MPHQATALRPQRSNSRTEVRDRILSALPSLAYQIATLHENPVSSKHERELRELLEKIIGALQVHQPIELLRDAVRQLAAASSAAEIQVKTLEAVIPNRRALAETKVNLQVLSASEVDTHFEVLDRARKVASQGGILRRYATEGVVLSAFLTLINQRRVVSPSIRMSTRVLPEVNTATETVIRMRAENISTARKQLDTEAKQHAQVLNLPTIRSLDRDRDRKEILGNFHNASTSLERVVALSRLRGDHDSEALNFQLKVLLDRKADSGVREVACCLLELVGAATPPKEGDEFARHLLIRVTQMLLCRKTESAELLMMLRVIASFGEAQISIVVTQLLEDSELRAKIKSSECEMAILILAMKLLERGGTASRVLEHLIFGVGIEHFSDVQRQVVQRCAAKALSMQAGGVACLLNIFECFSKRGANLELVEVIVDVLSVLESDEKVKIAAEMLSEAATSKNLEVLQTHYQRVIRILSTAKNESAIQLLIHVLLSPASSDTLRYESAVALRGMPKFGVDAIASVYPKLSDNEKLYALIALEGSFDSTRASLVVDALTREISSTVGVFGIIEKLEALKSAEHWELISTASH